MTLLLCFRNLLDIKNLQTALKYFIRFQNIVSNFDSFDTPIINCVCVTAQSPVFSHVSDTLVGLQSIRALGMNQKFLLDFNRFQNKHTIASFVFLASYRWFSLRSLFFLDVYFILVVFLSLALRDCKIFLFFPRSIHTSHEKY